jgi:hypothetical protein
VSLFYSGYSGSAFSFLYVTDANNDGTVNDLMYIPKNKDDFIWKNGDADADAYFEYAKSNSYLTDHAGEYAKRYAAYEPFFNRIDFRFLQDFYVNISGQKNTLQLSLDILNIPNLINSNWGINKMYIGSNLQATPLRYEGRDAATGKAIVSMSKLNDEYMTSAFQDPTSVASAWALQLGLRYIF